jgi:fumarate hydratase subunit alpha
MTNLLVDKVEKAVIKASTTYSQDRIDSFKKAYNNETSEHASWALDLMIKNMEIANKNKLPLCDDTGIPHVFVEVGKENKTISLSIIEDIKKGISNALKNLPGRPMAVKGNSIERLEQSKGLYSESEKLTPPSFLFDSYDNDKIRVHILLLGGGPEIRAKTYRVFHKRNYNEIINRAVDWLKESLPLLGCTPSIPAIGIGRTHFEANSEMLKAMAYGNLNNQSDIEKKLSIKVNNLNIGPLGLGGDTTVLGSFIKVGKQRASGVRILSLRPCCFVEPRVASFEL